MAFVRQKGKFFYLVHNVRTNGKAKQIHLCSLGRQPHLTDSMIEEVQAKHPDLNVDWELARIKVSAAGVQAS